MLKFSPVVLREIPIILGFFLLAQSTNATPLTPENKPSFPNQRQVTQEPDLSDNSQLIAQSLPRMATQADGLELIRRRASLKRFKSPQGNNPMSQVTNVSELQDVAPTDWAYEALRSLVERYGCIVGYPDRTFRGDRTLSRWEFSAGLNACLNTMERLLQENVAVLREDIEKLKRLAQEFEQELIALGARVDNLESRVAYLEDHQFSTTTKLQGEVVFVTGNEFNQEPELGKNNQFVFNNRVRLGLNTSFKGEDLLYVRLTSTNARPFTLTSPSDTASLGNTTQDSNTDDLGQERTVESVLWAPGFDGNTESNAKVNGANQTEISTQGTGRLANSIESMPNREDNTVFVDKIYYQLPINDFEVYAFATGGEHHDYAPTLNPYFEDLDGGFGAISTLSSENPIYRIGGGVGAAINFYDIFDFMTFTVGYLAGPNPADPSQSDGLFNGNYAALAQVTGEITDWFTLAFTYSHGYHPPGSAIFDRGIETGIVDEDGVVIPGGGVVGTAAANNPSAELTTGVPVEADQVKLPGDDFFTPVDQLSPEEAKVISPVLVNGEIVNEPVGLVPTVTNSYGVQASFRISQSLTLNAFGSYTDAILIGTGGADIFTFGAGLAILDVFKEGSVLGLFGGSQPFAGLIYGQDQRIGVKDVPYQAEVFYKYPITDNISITPAVMWLTAPNQNINDRDVDAVVGLLRTTFSF